MSVQNPANQTVSKTVAQARPCSGHPGEDQRQPVDPARRMFPIPGEMRPVGLPTRTGHSRLWDHQQPALEPSHGREHRSRQPMALGWRTVHGQISARQRDGGGAVMSRQPEEESCKRGNAPGVNREPRWWLVWGPRPAGSTAAEFLEHSRGKRPCLCGDTAPRTQSPQHCWPSCLLGTPPCPVLQAERRPAFGVRPRLRIAPGHPLDHRTRASSMWFCVRGAV